MEGGISRSRGALLHGAQPPCSATTTRHLWTLLHCNVLLLPACRYSDWKRFGPSLRQKQRAAGQVTLPSSQPLFGTASATNGPRPAKHTQLCTQSTDGPTPNARVAVLSRSDAIKRAGLLAVFFFVLSGRDHGREGHVQRASCGLSTTQVTRRTGS